MTLLSGSSWHAGGIIKRCRLLTPDNERPMSHVVHAQPGSIPVARSLNDATPEYPIGLYYKMLVPGEKFSVQAGEAFHVQTKLTCGVDGTVKAAKEGESCFAISLTESQGDKDMVIVLSIATPHIV